MQSVMRNAVRSALGRIVLANAADGRSLGLHADGRLRTAADVVDRTFDALDPADQDAEGLCRAIRDVCRGPASTGGLRPGSPFLGANPVRLARSSTPFSTVVTGPDVASLIHPADLRRMLEGVSVLTLASAGIEPGSYAERRLMARSPADRARRRVRLARGAQIGNPVAWMTRSELVEQAVDEAIRSGDSPAGMLTDRLGLIFPPFSDTRNALNQRFVLHVPFAVIARKASYRPTTVEAASYSRFKVRPLATPPPAGWGRTLDLGMLAAGRGLADGLDEITIDAILDRDFRLGEYIEVDYLGTVSHARGVTPGVDCDDTVARLLCAGRSTAQLMGAFR